MSLGVLLGTGLKERIPHIMKCGKYKWWEFFLNFKLVSLELVLGGNMAAQITDRVGLMEMKDEEKEGISETFHLVTQRRSI